MWRRCFLAQATAPVIGSISLSSRWNSCSGCNAEITVAVARSETLFVRAYNDLVSGTICSPRWALGQCPNCWWLRRREGTVKNTLRSFLESRLYESGITIWRNWLNSPLKNHLFKFTSYYYCILWTPSVKNILHLVLLFRQSTQRICNFSRKHA